MLRARERRSAPGRPRAVKAKPAPRRPGPVPRELQPVLRPPTPASQQLRAFGQVREPTAQTALSVTAEFCQQAPASFFLQQRYAAMQPFRRPGYPLYVPPIWSDRRPPGRRVATGDPAIRSMIVRPRSQSVRRALSIAHKNCLCVPYVSSLINTPRARRVFIRFRIAVVQICSAHKRLSDRLSHPSSPGSSQWTCNPHRAHARYDASTLR